MFGNIAAAAIPEADELMLFRRKNIDNCRESPLR
jgi:hypothetical protein